MKGAPIGLALIAIPGVAAAQAYQCTIPGQVPRPHVEAASDKEPQRILPISGYTLAISWAPQYCHEHSRDASARFQCGQGNRFGFTLHGLWPDEVGKDWPQYCASAALLPRTLIRRTLCATPSAQLIQHEWTKHGTCMQTTPDAYFARSTAMFGRLRYPDMNALSRRPMNAAAFAAAVGAANRGLPTSAIRVTADRRGWLSEVWLCLDRSFRYAACRPNSGGLAPGAVLKIWRGGR